MLSASFCPKIHAVHLLQGLHASQFFGARFFSRRTYKKKTDTVTFLHTLYKLKDIYYNDLWKCLILWRVRSIAASRLTKNSPPDCFCLYEAVPYSRTQLVLPEFDLGRLCGMTLYEILSLAIDLAILILTALSYLKDRKS